MLLVLIEPTAGTDALIVSQRKSCDRETSSGTPNWAFFPTAELVVRAGAHYVS